MTWAAEMDRLFAAADKANERVLREAAIALTTRIVKSSPVGNPSLWQGNPPAGYVGGRFRGNWFAAIGSPDLRATDNIDKDGGNTIGKAAAVASKMRLTDTFYLANSLPYAYRLEYDGWSMQAPQGMVRINVAAFKQFVDSIAKGQR